MKMLLWIENQWWKFEPIKDSAWSLRKSDKGWAIEEGSGRIVIGKRAGLMHWMEE
jgi:hypothetical protein